LKKVKLDGDIFKDDTRPMTWTFTDADFINDLKNRQIAATVLVSTAALCPKPKLATSRYKGGSWSRPFFWCAYRANIRTNSMILLSKNITDNLFVQ
jgi:hypothetical protein